MKHRLLSVLLCLSLIAALCALPAHADGLSYTVSYGAATGDRLEEETLPVDAEGAFTVDSVTGIPYVVYEIDTAGVKAIFPSSTILMEKPLLCKQRLFAFSQ